MSGFTVISNREAMAKKLEDILEEYLDERYCDNSQWHKKDVQSKMISGWTDRLLAAGCKAGDKA